MKNKGMLIVVSGPAGAGKGTICKTLLETEKSIHLSVSATTREPRFGEVDGISYHFLKKEKFLEMVENGEFLEYATFCGNMYGTPKFSVDEALARGQDIILEIEVQGAMQVKKLYPDAVMVFVLPPSYSILRERLEDRNTETPDVIEKRLSRALEELQFLDEYDYILINDEIDIAVNKLKSIISAEKNKTCRNKNLMQEWNI